MVNIFNHNAFDITQQTASMLKLAFIIAIKSDRVISSTIFGEDDQVNKTAAYHSTFQRLLDGGQVCYHSDMAFTGLLNNTSYDAEVKWLK